MAALSVSSSPMAMPMLTRSRRTFHLTTTSTKLVIITPRPSSSSINTSTSTSSSSSSLPSSSSTNNKIFEDPSTGIVCYRDENGEITCEGYDEGPRLHHNLFHYYNTPPTPIRDVEIIQLLQRCWFQLTSEDDDDAN